MPGQQVGSRSKRTRSRVTLLIASLCVTAVLLMGLEGLLRLTGVGSLHPSQASRLRYQQVYLPMFEAGRRPDGSDAWVTVDGRIPAQSVLRDKPADVFRVFAAGGSATAGLGYSPNVTFSRHLERMLRLALPDREIEVINLGVVALSSGQVRWIVDDVCRHQDPDLVVVYSGNNEFLEIHASKYAALLNPGGPSLAGRLAGTNLFRFISGLTREAPRGRDVSMADMATADSRVPETEIVAAIEISAAEQAGIVDAYEVNLEAMVASAQATDTPLLLMTVASNWEWRGKDDLPGSWLAELLELEPTGETPDFEQAMQRLEQGLANAAPEDRHDWLFKRATLLASEERWDEAVAAYRASMNSDPRQRRATDELADRVRVVAARHGVALIDTIERLGKLAGHGLVGFDEFYDYVHFTPRGCVLVAAEILRVLQRDGVLPARLPFDLDEHIATETSWYAEVQHDPLDVDRWLGVGGDVSRLWDRDLWKHQSVLRELDERVSLDRTDVEALIWHGNAMFFSVGGQAAARRDYETALELEPDNAAARANLERLSGSRHP
jgi:tetratricopeptide (TPR) repeat protein